MLDSLRHRLVAATFGLVVGVCAIFSIGAYLAFEFADDVLFDAHTEADIRSLLSLYEQYPDSINLPQENFRVYSARADSAENLPAALRALDPGDDEVVLDGLEYDVDIRQRNGTTFYFLLDESTSDAFEHVFFSTLTLIVVAVIVGAGWLSMGLAQRVIQPLTSLAAQVAHLDDSEGTEIRIQTTLKANDPIYMLAAAINRYHQRISDLLHREREFSADVSHELRTPLMGIQGASELLQRKCREDPDLEPLLLRIRRGCLHMTTLTDALLYLARDPASFSDLVEPVDLDKVVDDQIAAVRDITAAKGILVNVERNSDPGTIYTIPAVINIVIGNILKNAVKYTDRNVVNVFRARGEVVIQDYGPGVDQATQARLFDRFNRGQTRDADGSGIGLALVRRFCDQYGWTIDFRSDEHKGTRVAIEF